MSIRTVKRNRESVLVVFFFVIALTGSFGPSQVDAQNTDLVMTGTQIHIQLLANGTSQISLSTNMTNIGEQPLESIGIRFDVRRLTFLQSTIDGNPVSGQQIAVDNYILVRLQTAASLLPRQSSIVEIEMTTDTIQEIIGFCEEEEGCVMYAIYYFRPLNEIRNLTVSMSLPVHAALQQTTALPVFPLPHNNYTDGSRMVFSWNIASIFPGQERVYITRYIIPGHQTAMTETHSILIPSILAATLAGAIIALTLERIPKIVRSLREPKIVNHGVTQHEEEILRLLSKKEGKCLQRDIYDELGMSQSLASMVLTGMEDRGLVKRVREGRENVVYLIND